MNALLQSCTAAARGKFDLLRIIIILRASRSCSSWFLRGLGVDISKTRVIPKQWGVQVWERMGSWFGSAASVKGFTLNLPRFLKPCQAIAGPSLSPHLSDFHRFSQPASYWLAAGIWFPPLIIAWESKQSPLLFWKLLHLIMCLEFSFCKTPFTANLKTVVSASLWGTSVFLWILLLFWTPWYP